MGTIIVVDEEQSVRELYSSWLSAHGHTVCASRSGGDAREFLQSQTADVLVTEIAVAEPPSGIELLAWARKHDPSMAVVLVTGVPDVHSAVEALRLKAYDYLLKPVPEAALVRSVGRAAAHSHLMRHNLALEEQNRRYRQHLEELVVERTVALQRRNQQLMLLHDVTTTIGILQDRTALYQKTVNAVRDSLGYPVACIFRVEAPAGMLVLEAVAGLPPEVLASGYQQPLARGLQGAALQTRQAIVANDVSRWTEFAPIEGLSTAAEAIVPIYVDGNPLAMLYVSEDLPDAFDDTDRMVLQTLGDHLGVALSNTLLYSQLREALITREQILQNVSHELRTPLTLISGYAEFLTESLPAEVPDSVRELPETILEQTQHLGHLVNQLIMFQTIERGQKSWESLNMELWLQGLAEVWKSVLERNGLVLQAEIQPNLGHAYGSWDHLTQAMQNLLDNARKFSPKGGTITLRGWREQQAIFVSLSDEGVGVSAEKLSQLFDRFYQADAGSTRRFGGMGLGLALVREIILQHDGRLWATSPGEGQGLTISFSLPAAA